MKFDIVEKISAITTDSASNNVTAKGHNPTLGKTTKFQFNHVRCAAHIINLSVELALKELKNDVKLVEYFVDVLTSSGKRKEKFQVIPRRLIGDNVSADNALQLGFNTATSNELIQDVQIQINSTHLLLDRAYMLRTAVDATR